ncbi:sensor histidine kinase [Actinomadura scrupuli]|uniref:sensor histidine kinase n=1 Tax=Actinomadura scrupuli TaxID=559629 RepID=UPI003D96B8F2
MRFVSVTGRGRPPLRLLGVAVLVAWAVGGYLAGTLQSVSHTTGNGTRGAVWLLNLAGFLAVATVIRARCRLGRWVPWLLTGAVAAALLLLVIVPGGPSIALAYLAVGVAAASLPLRWGAGLAALGIAGVLMAGYVTESRLDIWSAIGFAGVFFAGMTARERDALRESQARNEVLADRAHLAREIHDILAHSLSAQIVHLEGARLLLAGDGGREQILERVESAQRLARSGLEETRRALATLRGEIPPPEEALAELAEEFRAATGRPCDVEITGPCRELTPEARLAVVRTAQEALTNVRRHAPGARALVRLRYRDADVELDMTDDGGSGHAERSPGSGYGLVGMRERAELIGGTLESGRAGGGFRVILRVPA